MIIVLTSATLIDVTGREPIKQSRVVFENGIITAVGREDDVSIPPNGEIIDVAGKTVIPGLIDAHIHMDLHGYADTYTENLVGLYKNHGNRCCYESRRSTGCGTFLRIP